MPAFAARLECPRVKTDLLDHLGSLGTFLGGGVATALVSGVLRIVRKPASSAEEKTADAELRRAVTEATKVAFEQLNSDVQRLNHRCDESDQHRAKCETDLARALAQIDILMEERVANYGDPAPKD